MPTQAAFHSGHVYPCVSSRAFNGLAKALGSDAPVSLTFDSGIIHTVTLFGEVEIGAVSVDISEFQQSQVSAVGAGHVVTTVSSYR